MIKFIEYFPIFACLSGAIALTIPAAASGQNASVAFVGQLNQNQNSPFLTQLPRNARPKVKAPDAQVRQRQTEAYTAQTSVGRQVNITDFSEQKEAAILKLPNVRYGVQSLRQATGG